MGKPHGEFFFDSVAAFPGTKSAPLDKIAQLGTRSGFEGTAPGQVEGLPALKKRARSKTYSDAVKRGLVRLDSPLNKSYFGSMLCVNALEQRGQKLTSRYCNARWCTTCNRIRTAQLINGYAPVLARLRDLQFVTLTIPNVPASDLRVTIQAMTKSAQRIQDAHKKRHSRGLQSWQLVGLRKLECTHNWKTDTFHPHFHYLVEGKEAAAALVRDWLAANPTATHKAQDLRKARAGAEKEMFKYFSKLVTDQKGVKVTDTASLDVIFQAMRGARVFQPVGIKKEVSEDIAALQSVETDIEPLAYELWRWFGTDWASHETGETLTGYVPSPQMQELIKNIR